MSAAHAELGQHVQLADQTGSRGSAFTGLVASLAPLVSPYGLPLAGLMLVLRTSTPARHKLGLCLSPTARQFPVPRAAIRAGGRRDIRLHRLTA